MQRLSLWGGEAVRELDCSGNSEQRMWLVLNPPTSPPPAALLGLPLLQCCANRSLVIASGRPLGREETKAFSSPCWRCPELLLRRPFACVRTELPSSRKAAGENPPCPRFGALGRAATLQRRWRVLGHAFPCSLPDKYLQLTTEKRGGRRGETSVNSLGPCCVVILI